MQFLETPVQIGLTALLVIAAVVVLVRGGLPERLAMVGVIIASLATPLVQDTTNLNEPQWGIMAVDSALFAAFAALTWRFPRPWLPWASAFQLITVMTHVGIALNANILGRAYLSTSYLLFFGVLIAICWGVARPDRSGHDQIQGQGGAQRL